MVLEFGKWIILIPDNEIFISIFVLQAKMVFAIYHTSTFDKHLEKMPKDFKEWVEKIEDQLVL